MARRARTSTDPRTVVGYIRVSTEEQHLGPEAQRAALDAWCNAHGATLVAVHLDLGVSGGAPLDRRPALLAALDSVTDHGAGVLLVAKRDRLARDVVLAAMVERLAERHGARVQSADGTGNGEGPEAMLMRGIVDLFAQYERAVIRARTRSALAVKRSKGERTGQVPYGYRLADDGTHLEVDPTEQRVVNLIAALRADGVSYRAIADRLNSDDVPSRGERWHHTTIHRVASRDAA